MTTSKIDRQVQEIASSMREVGVERSYTWALSECRLGSTGVWLAPIWIESNGEKKPFVREWEGNPTYRASRESEELVTSLKRDGILLAKPFIPDARNKCIYLVDGNRTRRAALEAGLTEIPVVPPNLNGRLTTAMNHGTIDAIMAEIAAIINTHVKPWVTSDVIETYARHPSIRDKVSAGRRRTIQQAKQFFTTKEMLDLAKRGKFSAFALDVARKLAREFGLTRRQQRALAVRMMHQHGLAAAIAHLMLDRAGAAPHSRNVKLRQIMDDIFAGRSRIRWVQGDRPGSDG